MLENTDTHLLDIYEEKIKLVEANVLKETQYCVIQDPIGPDGLNKLGTRELRKGALKFFLHPGESLEGGIQDIHKLGKDEALLLRALEKVEDKAPGDKWMIHGPCLYIPPI